MNIKGARIELRFEVEGGKYNFIEMGKYNFHGLIF